MPILTALESKPTQSLPNFTEVALNKKNCVSFYLVQGPDYYQLHLLPAAALPNMWAVGGVDYNDMAQEMRCSCQIK